MILPNILFGKTFPSTRSILRVKGLATSLGFSSYVQRLLKLEYRRIHFELLVREQIQYFPDFYSPPSRMKWRFIALWNYLTLYILFLIINPILKLKTWTYCIVELPVKMLYILFLIINQILKLKTWSYSLTLR